MGAAPGDGHMLLFWDGGSAPSGWSCVSCSPGDPFYQRFPRANQTYGAVGGSASHSHTVTAVADASTATASFATSGTAIADRTHSHSASATVSTVSSLPGYRQLNIIRRDNPGEPGTLPAGAIALFDEAVPSGWTRYAAQDGYYPYGGSSAGSTGGNNNHNHTVNGSLDTASGITQGQVNFFGSPSARSNHTHTFSGTNNSVNHEPPYITAIFGKLNSVSTSPDGMLAMWDDDAPSNWTIQSGSSGSFYQRFIKGSATYGSIGGTLSHTHNDHSVVSSGPSGGSLSSLGGSQTASGSHTHQVHLTNYSTEDNIPPYRDVIIAKRVPQSETNLAAYRVYKNHNSTDIGEPLANQNTIGTTPKKGRTFRVRMLITVTSANLGIANKVFKLQVAERSGTCDTGFIGETYSDITSSEGNIRFADNTNAADGASLTVNAADPTSSNPIIAQTYEEDNTFTNNAEIAIGQDGMWDFALVDYASNASTSYCLRVVYGDGTLLDDYSVIPQIITDDGSGHMLLYYAGTTVPSGWECVSCLPEDDLYQRFARGSDAYGAKGGSATHSHSADGSVGGSSTNTVSTNANNGISTNSHTHTFNPIISNTNLLPQYRQLKIIRAEVSGVPNQLPAGVIAIFDGTLPTGWTRYSAQDGYYIRGENTVGTTGGSNTHSHSITGTTGAAVGEAGSGGGIFGLVSAAVHGHTHNVNGSTNSVNHEPLYRAVILARLNSASPAPLNIIAMWDETPPLSWTRMSDEGGPLYERFTKAAATYGGTGGNASHSHANVNINTSGPSITTNVANNGTNSSGSHTHTVTVSNISSEDNLPPYTDVIYAKQGALNTAPYSPANSQQLRSSDNSPITVGAYSNGSQVTFRAEVEDPDPVDSLQLCIEIELIGTNFDNNPTQCGASVDYTGEPVEAEMTINGLSDGASYHWQARVKDGGGAISSWTAFGGNPENQADFIMDSSAPTGSVYDGDITGSDQEYNDGALDNLSANWEFTDSGSGLMGYEYAIGTAPSSTDIKPYTSVGLNDSVTAPSLALTTTQVYYFSIRAVDNAGNENVISSDGQLVAPSISFSASTGSITFNGLNPGNGYTDTQTTTLQTTTNAKNGYVIRAYATGLLTSSNGETIDMFDGGTYANPDRWNPNDKGFGYTSSDTLVQGVNKFHAPMCFDGGTNSCFAPYSLTSPGDIVADNPGPVSGTAILNEIFTITHRVTTNNVQETGKYTTTLVFNASVSF